MPIGELLIEQRKLSASDLERALDRQRREGKRLVSLLIASGALDFDTGSRALGTQRGVPALLEKHLASRDAKLARLIPAESGRAWGALPVGRASNGSLIVAARNPSALLKLQVAEVTRMTVTIVIAPATRLEELIAKEYGSAPVGEFDIEVESSLELEPMNAGESMVPPMPDMSALDPESVRLALTNLDDERVTKDAAASGQFLATGRNSPTLPPAPPSLDVTRERLETATTRDAATDAAIAFIAGQWVSGLVLAIRRDFAVGFRGHGAAIGTVDQIAIPLDAASTLKSALETKRPSIRLYDTIAQKDLAKRLATSSLAAAPVIVGSQPIAAIVVGEPIHGLGQTEKWIGELGRLAQMLGQAYARLMGDRRS